MALGASGVGEEENGQGFWTKNILTVKHVTNYASEWFRRAGDAYASQRALMELHLPPIESAVRSGAASGFMTSFGRSNGIPNPISPLISRVHGLSPWSSRGGLYCIPDYHAETQLGEPNAFANAYDSSYSPTLDDGVALMMVAEAGGAATDDDPDDTWRGSMPSWRAWRLARTA